MKFLKIIYYIFLSAVVLIALLLVISTFPISGNIKVLTVLSGSMEPAIHMGSVVIVKPTTDYKIGDTITFGLNTKTQIPTTHRIAEVRVQDGQTVYKTKGDANNAEDSKEILTKDIIGKVYFSVPYAGYVVDFIKKPIGLILVVVLPAIYIGFGEVMKIVKEIKKIKKKKEEKNNFEENV
jgi:signal peptidase